MELYFNALRNYINFSGRASREEFLAFYGVNTLLYFLLFYLSEYFGYQNLLVEWLSAIFAILTFIPMWAVLFRRIHDLGKSGWYVLIAFIPILNLVLLYQLSQPGKPFTNKYGPSPYGPIDR